jgi:hypothetical protein
MTRKSYMCHDVLFSFVKKIVKQTRQLFKPTVSNKIIQSYCAFLEVSVRKNEVFKFVIESYIEL